MRWLLLFAVLVLGAVGLFVLLPDDPEVKAAAGVAEQVRREVGVEPPAAEQPVILEHGGTVVAPPAVVAEPADAGVVIRVLFEQIDARGRVAGASFALQWDGGRPINGLADAMGFAHIDVPQGNWKVECWPDCGDVSLFIAPGYDHFLLPVVEHYVVKGTVEDLEGAPVPNALIAPAGGGPEGYATSRSDGSFSFSVTSHVLSVIAKHDGDSSVPVVVSVPQAKPLKLVVRPSSPVRFVFPGFRTETVSMTSVIGDAPFSYQVGESRLVWLPVGNHEAVVRTWRDGKTYAAKANFRVFVEKRMNKVEIVLRPEPGLRVRVTDTSGQPLPNVPVIAFRSRPDMVDPDGGCAVLVQADGGRRCADVFEAAAARGLTDNDGVFEATPVESEAEPLYQLSLEGDWRAQHRALMRLGDEPVTLVAVPR
ncbi:MAG: hypothetical protein QM723_19860 [Myxococcaceae bacterium]